MKISTFTTIQKGGGRIPDPPPETSQKYRVSSNTGPYPLKNHKATKSAFNVGPSSVSHLSGVSMAGR